MNSATGLDASYAYNVDGLRMAKTVNGVDHKYIWQGGRLVSEAYGGRELEFFYDEAATPVPCGIDPAQARSLWCTTMSRTSRVMC